MKLSVFSPVFTGLTLEEALKYLKDKGVDSLELGCGGYPGTAHADAKELIKSDAKIKELQNLFEKYGISISALSVHGNGVHPIKKIADKATQDFTAACMLAEKLNVNRVVTFSGCPGDGKGDQPNWVTCAWPDEFGDVLKYQWEDVLLPYWQKQAKTADDYNVKVCFEMHPGFCVYNPETLLKIRSKVGETLGANLDPSHLFWQGIDIFAAIKKLGKAIYFFHAKDTYIDKTNCDINGVLDTKPYSDELNRSWIFRTVGYGNSESVWKEIISALRLVGYDHAVSIEHEDGLMSPLEGLGKAIDFIKKVIIEEGGITEKWWI
ncbi:MAG: sugar phosphate isomerase/epimerase [Clostridia bacterium]|nr:sugar phosphate isomerase/epimerase [Clostridia bacterium]